MKFIPVYVFIFLLGVAIAQAIFYFPVMPDPMASHFGFGGEADRWSGKNAFFIFDAIILLATVLIFILMPWVFENFRVKKSVNLPNKEYWFADERVEYVYIYFRKSFAWFGSATLILLVVVMQLTFEANFLPKPVLNKESFLIIFFGYITFVIVWLVSFYRKFSRTE